MPNSGSEKPEIIAPIKISRKDKGPGPPGSGRRNSFKFMALGFVCLLLMAGGALLLNYLSKHPVDTAEITDLSGKRKVNGNEHAVETSEYQPAETVNPTRVAAERGRAEQKLADFTRIKNGLEDIGASEWGGILYNEMIQLSQEADAFFIEKDYIYASEKYTHATGKANELAGQIGDAYQRMIEEGRIALDEGDGELARKRYRVALMIDPSDQLAQHGLERAKNIEKVSALIASGKHHEKNADLSFAHTDYQEALRLDPESMEARKALDRIKGQIKNEAFQRLMAEGLTAFHSNNYKLARANLLKAKSFKPESKEVEDALAEIDQAIRLARIEELRKNALNSEYSENWEQALKSYLAVLEIDPNIQFAAQGKERSLNQIRIIKRINFFLENPNVLESDSQLGNAVLLISEVEAIEPNGPQLIARLRELKRLVESAQTPVKLAIESDGMTEVAVYKVGKLGRFAVRELNLRPGTYTVVGARDGYKDVRQKVVIKPGQGPLRITIKCRVKI